MSTPTQWSPELEAELTSAYVAKIELFPEDERPGVSMEIVAEIAKEHGVSPNGLRMKLSKAGVYVKKEAGKATAKTGGDAPKSGGRTSKSDAQAELRAAFNDAGLEDGFLDESIVDKLTGKAAAHLAEAIRKITK